MSKDTCTVEGCDKPVKIKIRGLCENHHYRWKTHGDPLAGQIRGNDEARFWRDVEEWPAPIRRPELGPCWVWTGSLYPSGYAQFTYSPRRGHKVNSVAHRYLYERMVCAVPDGLELDHLCRVRRCVNPYHLDPVTHGVNIKRGALPGVTRRRFAERRTQK